ncbi:MAG: chromate efflux transporter [Candidatus Korobacteraceae bacterium]
MSDSSSLPPAAAGSAREVLWAFLRLGCISFGGPIAHLGYFHAEFVERRRWFSEQSYAEVVALAQSLPGPASSQVGFALGLLRAGWLGGFAAWFGFTLPSALLMLAFALGHSRITGKLGQGAVHGLQLVAVAVVAQAILAMRKKLAPDALRMALALLAAVMVYVSGQTVLAIAFGALLGWLLLRKPHPTQLHPDSAGLTPAITAALSRRAGLAAGALFCALLLFLPIAASLSAKLTAAHSASQPLAVTNAFFRSGALVFGGGHVVLPLLERAVVARGWVDQAAFLSGYGAAQAIPGPLFTFAAYLGAVIRPTPSPVAFGALALVAIFLPGLLLIAALLPFWSGLRQLRWMQSCLAGVNAAVVGILLAAFIRPVCSSAVHSLFDLVVALAALLLLVRYKLPPWQIVVSVALLSALVQML